MTTLKTFTLEVHSEFSREKTLELLNMLVSGGQADAQATADDPDMSEKAHDDADKALSLGIAIR